MLLHNTYIYILIMSAVTYLIRTLPLTLIRKEIKNTTIKSFLYYVPYVTLAVMIAVVLAWMGKSLFQVAMFSCAAVFIVELVMRFMAG